MNFPRAAATLILVVLAASGCSGLRRGGMLGGEVVQRDAVTLPADAPALGHFLRAEVALTHNDLETATAEFEKAVAADPDTPMLRVRLAALYVRNGQLDKALGQAQKVTAAEPANVEAAELRAGILSALGRDDEAIEAYERVLALDPDRQEAYLFLGALQSKKGDSERAIATLHLLVAKNPSSVLGYYYLGRVHASARQLDKAEHYYLEALRLSPQSELILTDLALAYELQGRMDKAVELYERILAANPESLAVRRRLGSIYVGQKRLDEAIAQFRELEKVDTDPADARIKIGLIYFEKGDLNRAATELNLVLAAQPSNARVRYYLSAIAVERGEVAKAVAGFGDIPPESEYFVDARIRRASLVEKDDPVQATREIEQALELKRDNPELMSYLASLYREQKSPQKSIEILQRLVTRFPEDDRYHFTLGAAFDEIQDKERMIEQMRRAIELNPRNAAALNYLGYSFAEMGVKLDEAEALIRQALALDPNDGFYVDSLGWVYYQRGDYRRAIEQLERAVELAGDDPTVTEHLGDAYSRGGRSEAALRVYRDALARAKETPQIERLKGKIHVLEGAAHADESRL